MMCPAAGADPGHQVLEGRMRIITSIIVAALSCVSGAANADSYCLREEAGVRHFETMTADYFQFAPKLAMVRLALTPTEPGIAGEISLYYGIPRRASLSSILELEAEAELLTEIPFASGLEEWEQVLTLKVPTKRTLLWIRSYRAGAPSPSCGRTHYILIDPAAIKRGKETRFEARELIRDANGSE